jgi:hypothetical protein
MNAIVFNCATSTLSPASESVCLRIAYMLCENMASAGDSYNAIFYEHYEERQKTESKINFIDNHFKSTNEKTEWNSALIKLRLKNFSKLKHPSPAEIVAKKKVDKYIRDMYAYATAGVRAALFTSGLMQLQKLFENHDELRCICTTLEAPEKESEDFVPYSKILKRKVEATDGSDLFFLPSEFFDVEFFNQWSIGESAGSKEARKGNGYVQHCFSLPNLNLLSVTELEHLHDEIKKVAGPFWQKTNEWMKMVYEGKDASVTTKLMEKEIMPATASMLHLLAENEILVNASRLQNDELVIDMYLGEVSVEIIWNYYKHTKVIGDETWQKLLEAKDDDEFKSRRWPFMAMRVSNASLMEINQEEKTEEFKIAPVKKYISID